jgi:hypothetical protein
MPILVYNSVVDPNWFQCGSWSSIYLNTNPDPDPGQTFKSQKVEFLDEKYNKSWQEVKKYTYEGTKAFLKGRFIWKFWSISMLPDPQSQYGAGSRNAKWRQIQADPDPQHWFIAPGCPARFRAKMSASPVRYGVNMEYRTVIPY